MNKVLLILSIAFITAGVLAQVPEKMSYQAVVRNGKNTLVANQPIGLRISILQGAVNGPKVYQEIFHPNPVTNANGLVTAEIGSGTPILGAFSSIDWANVPYFIKAETDTTGGTNYTITGTTRLLSVPYALHAKTAESFSGTISETDPAFSAWDKDYNDLLKKPDLNVYATHDMVNQNIANLDYNNIVNKPDLSIYATTDLVNQNITSRDYNDLINKPDLSVYATKDLVNQTYLNYNEIINKPDLSVYATKDMVNQTYLNYNEIISKPDLSVYATKDMANQNITNLAYPVNAQDAATKAYVDLLLKRLEELGTDKPLAEGFIDARDGNHYKVVKIGSQLWMAENLKYLPDLAVPPLSHTEQQYFVLGYEGTNVNEARATKYYKTFGVFYNWPAAMNGLPESNSNPVGMQGVCPSGWHLPSNAEWGQLVDFLGGKNVAGGKMKETGTRYWWYPNTGATNESGFTALPGEETFDDSWIFGEIGNNSFYWSSSTNRNIPDFISISSSQKSVNFPELLRDSIDFVNYYERTEYDEWGEYFDEFFENYQDYEEYVEYERVNTQKRRFSVRCVKD